MTRTRHLDEKKLSNEISSERPVSRRESLVSLTRIARRYRIDPSSNTRSLAPSPAEGASKNTSADSSRREHQDGLSRKEMSKVDLSS